MISKSNKLYLQLLNQIKYLNEEERYEFKQLLKKFQMDSVELLAKSGKILNYDEATELWRQEKKSKDEYQKCSCGTNAKWFVTINGIDFCYKCHTNYHTQYKKMDKIFNPKNHNSKSFKTKKRLKKKVI